MLSCYIFNISLSAYVFEESFGWKIPYLLTEQTNILHEKFSVFYRKFLLTICQEAAEIAVFYSHFLFKLARDVVRSVPLILTIDE